MTGIARQRGVRADQGKAILMLLDVLDGDLPALHRVTLLAIGSQLPAMDVSMAIGAALADVRKNKLGMALRARG